jgi:hypothetical protein
VVGGVTVVGGADGVTIGWVVGGAAVVEGAGATATPDEASSTLDEQAAAVSSTPATAKPAATRREAGLVKVFLSMVMPTSLRSGGLGRIGPERTSGYS